MTRSEEAAGRQDRARTTLLNVGEANLEALANIKVLVADGCDDPRPALELLSHFDTYPLR